MSNYLIFIDLDGTLRNSSRQISTQTKEITANGNYNVKVLEIM